MNNERFSRRPENDNTQGEPGVSLLGENSILDISKETYELSLVVQ